MQRATAGTEEVGDFLAGVLSVSQYNMLSCLKFQAFVVWRKIFLDFLRIEAGSGSCRLLTTPDLDPLIKAHELQAVQLYCCTLMGNLKQRSSVHNYANKEEVRWGAGMLA